MIIYALVARGTCVLAEHTATAGNFALVTRRILERLPQEEGRASYSYDTSHSFHCVIRAGLAFLCMADSRTEQAAAHAFLDAVQSRWSAAYAEKGLTALAYAMNSQFAAVLKELMESFSSAAGSSAGGAAASSSDQADAANVSRVEGELEEVRQVMVENIEKVSKRARDCARLHEVALDCTRLHEQVLARGEKIELLVDKTEHLTHQAFQFRRTTTRVKRGMYCKSLKLNLFLCTLLLLVIGARATASRSAPTRPPSHPPSSVRE